MTASVRPDGKTKTVCPHCGDDSGTCVSLRCNGCGALLCSRQVTPVLPSNPFYPFKHSREGHACGPIIALLLDESTADDSKFGHQPD